MTKRQTKVTITLISGGTVVYDDAVAAGSGTSAATSIEAHEMVIGPVGENKIKTYVPFHAIAKAEIEFTTSEVEAPTDDTCVTA